MMNRRKVIAISGKAGAGKDTLGKVLTEKYGCVRFAMADSMKEEVANCFNLPELCFHDRGRKDAPLPRYPKLISDLDSAIFQQIVQSELVNDYWTPRALCILYGTMARAVNPNHWVSRVFYQIDSLPGLLPAVITDVRYLSEVKYLEKRFKGAIVFAHINRKDNRRERPSLSVSECELDSGNHATVTIENTGVSLEQDADFIWRKFDE